MKKIGILLMIGAVFATSCKNNADNNGEEIQQTENQAMQAGNKENDWKEIYNGENLEGWKAYNADEISDQWKTENEVLTFTPAEGEREGSENLITEDQYTSFELSLEWNISEGGNSGIMWGVKEGEEFNEPYLTGPEIQILDNERHPDAENGPIRQSGALYDMVPPNEDVTKPAGEWNAIVIRIDYEENRGSVTLNGTQVNEFPLHGEEWNNLVEQSKFKDWEDFGKYRTGHIALQDHGDEISFRNIKIKELD